MSFDPVTCSPTNTLAEVDALCARFRISGLPVTDERGELVGIITNRDMRFEVDKSRRVDEVMTRAPRTLPDTALALEQRLQRRKVGLQSTQSAQMQLLDAQSAGLRAQVATAERELARTRRLYAAEAATAQQLDRADGEVRVLREQLSAARSAASVVREEGTGADARLAQLDEQIRRSRIVNPIAGTVLSSFAEAGEFVQPGQPLYTIADLGTLTLRVYVTGPQLAQLRLGQRFELGQHGLPLLRIAEPPKHPIALVVRLAV